MEHSDRVKNELSKINENCKQLNSIGSNIMKAGSGNFSPLDWVVVGIVKRCWSVSSAIELLLNEWNMICARALVRMQLDTVLRFSAFWISKDPQKTAKDFRAGKQINHMKDREDNKMTDSYLARKLGEYFEWIPKVYRSTSGYIHFSERYLFDPIFNLDEERRLVTFVINDKDVKFPESSWFEIPKCINDCLLIIIYWLKHYLQVKESEQNKL